VYLAEEKKRTKETNQGLIVLGEEMKRKGNNVM